ncbi:hypothetical protein AAVH_38122, partial [Aphelenchoides avenae]
STSSSRRKFWQVSAIAQTAKPSALRKLSAKYCKHLNKCKQFSSEPMRTIVPSSRISWRNSRTRITSWNIRQQPKSCSAGYTKMCTSL